MADKETSHFTSHLLPKRKLKPTLNGRSHTNNLPGHLCPMELRPPRAKKSHTQSSSAWNAVQNRKMFQLQKNREVQTQWNTSHTHLERGTNFIIIQVRLHHRTAWNAAFTTWKKAAQNLHFFPDRHVQWNAGYKEPCTKDPSITPAVAPAGAAPSSSSSSTRPVAAPSIQMSKFLQKPLLERGPNEVRHEVRTKSERGPKETLKVSRTLLPIPLKKHVKAHSQAPTLHVKENGWNDDINNHIAQPHHITSSHITSDKNRT